MQKIRQKSQSFIHLRLLAVLAVLAGLAGCAKTDSGGPPSGTFANVYQNILGTQTCTQCHVTGDTSATQAGVHLDFSTQANAYATLVSNAATKTVSATDANSCRGILLVNPGQPNTSYLMGILVASFDTTNFANTPCTPNNTHVEAQYVTSTDQVNSLTTWIQNGAQNN